MKSIAIANSKGGVGKSSLTLALAMELAKTSNVVLADSDPQGNSTGALKEKVSGQFADWLFDDQQKIEEISTETDIKNLYLLPTVPVSAEKNGINKLRLYKQTTAQKEWFKMQQLTEGLSKYFNFCLFDTCPAFDDFEENIFYACDEVIVIVRPDQFSNDGLTIFYENLKDFQKRRNTKKPVFTKIILNGYDARFTYHKDFRNELMKQDKYEIFIVPADPAFGKSQQKRCSIFDMDLKQETRETLARLAEALRKQEA